MDVQCEQRNCGKTLDLHDEAVFCRWCQKYFCQQDYDAYHEQHDSDENIDMKWALALQR